LYHILQLDNRENVEAFFHRVNPLQNVLLSWFVISSRNANRRRSEWLTSRCIRFVIPTKPRNIEPVVEVEIFVVYAANSVQRRKTLAAQGFVGMAGQHGRPIPCRW
jgi:hypothetical protein